MTSDRIRGLEDLLARTESAHGAYEATELNGIYDQEWPRWYAQYAVDNGIGNLLGRTVSVDELARFLMRSWEELQRSDAEPTESWTTHIARKIGNEL
jgi:hypothetical protein